MSKRSPHIAAPGSKLPAARSAELQASARRQTRREHSTETAEDYAEAIAELNATVGEMIPLIIASVVGALCSKIVLQEHILLSFRLAQAFNYMNVPYYIALGMFAGMISLYYVRMFEFIEKLLGKFRLHSYRRALIGGVSVALLCFVFPPLFGEGYESIKLLAEGKHGLKRSPGDELSEQELNDLVASILWILRLPPVVMDMSA